MTGANWSLIEIAARLLEREEREAVLGDLVESRESAWDGLFGVLGLVLRRQAMLWRSWRPWLAGFGVALPSSFLLMGVSLSVSWSYLTVTMPRASPEVVADIGLRNPGAVVQGTAFNRLVLDGRLCSRIIVAPDSLG